MFNWTMILYSVAFICGVSILTVAVIKYIGKPVHYKSLMIFGPCFVVYMALCTMKTGVPVYIQFRVGTLIIFLSICVGLILFKRYQVSYAWIIAIVLGFVSCLGAFYVLPSLAIDTLQDVGNISQRITRILTLCAVMWWWFMFFRQNNN